MTEIQKKVRAKVDYANGKIYRLWSNESDCFYIGSTASTLRQRLSFHKQANLVGYTNVKIELIEYFPCKSKIELNAREGFHIRNHDGVLLNRNIPGRTDRQRYRDQRKKRLNYAAKYYEMHKERILENNRQRRRGIVKPKRAKLTDEDRRERNKRSQALHYQKHRNVLKKISSEEESN